MVAVGCGAGCGCGCGCGRVRCGLRFGHALRLGRGHAFYMHMQMRKGLREACMALRPTEGCCDMHMCVAVSCAYRYAHATNPAAPPHTCTTKHTPHSLNMYTHTLNSPYRIMLWHAFMLLLCWGRKHVAAGKHKPNRNRNPNPTRPQQTYIPVHTYVRAIHTYNYAFNTLAQGLKSKP